MGTHFPDEDTEAQKSPLTRPSRTTKEWQREDLNLVAWLWSPALKATLQVE